MSAAGVSRIRLIFLFAILALAGCDNPEAAPPVPPSAASTPEPLRLPVLKADVLAALERNGFTLTPEDAESQALTLSRYRVAESSAVVLFIEQGSRLDTIAVTMERRGPASDGARAVDAAAVILATASLTTREQARQAIGETIAKLGREATDPRRVVGFVSNQVAVRAVRNATGDITLTIVPSLNRQP